MYMTYIAHSEPIFKAVRCLKIIGYEPADLTVHPPPKKNYRGWVHFFRIGL